MASDETSAQPPTTPTSGNPPELHRETPSVRAIERAVDRLETQRAIMERDVDESRKDMRDVRDRLARLEVKVDHLPSKVWIGTVVAAGAAFLGVLLAVLSRLGGH